MTAIEFMRRVPSVAKLLVLALFFTLIASYFVFDAIMPKAVSDGMVVSTKKISDLDGNFLATLDNGDDFGIGVEEIGDLDGDGIRDFAVGAWMDDDGGSDLGAVYILFMTAADTVKSFQKISSTTGGFGGTLTANGDFGQAITSLGDLDGDGVIDLAVGERASHDSGNNRGSVWILFMNADGTVKAEQEISDSQGDFTATLEDDDLFGGCVEKMGDLDGDGVTDLVVCASQDDDGGTDRGAFYVLYLETDGTVKSFLKHSDTTGGFTGTLEDSDKWGSYVAKLSDLDGDGIEDWVTSAPLHDDGGSNRGALYVLFMNADETVKSFQKISESVGGFSGNLGNEDRFGSSIDRFSDLDADGVDDLVVGAWQDDDGNSNAGAVYVLFLNEDGTVKSSQKISETEGGFTGELDDDDIFGFQLATYVVHDGSKKLVVGAAWDDDGGTDRGAVYVLTLNNFFDTSLPIIVPRNVSVEINGGECVTQRQLDLRVHGDNAKDIVVSHHPYFVGATWQSYLQPSPMSLSYELPDQDGEYTLFVLLRSRTRNLSQVFAHTIELDQQTNCQN